MGNSYECLCKPFKIGSLTLKNRFCMAPIGGNQHYSAQGGFSENAIQYLVERAKGGFGLIFTGAIVSDYEVDPYSGIGPSPLQTPDAFKFSATELNERAGAYGAKIFAQITMGLGRNYPELPAPSAVPVFDHAGMLSPVLTNEQIKKKINAVVKTAKLAKESGFSGVEVHAIHWGYLLDQFAMSFMNHRNDEYGGSLENRLRAAKEILEGIKQVCGKEYPVSMRLGLKTFIKGFGKASLTGEEEAGRTLEEGIHIAKLLEGYGYDSLSVDAGVYDSFYYACPPMYMVKGYTIALAEKAKAAVHIPILGGGRMNDPDLAEAAIRDGKVDAIVMGRAALADPNYPNKVITGQSDKIRPCLACNQGCITRLQQGLQPSCAVNPAAMRETRHGLKPSLQTKEVVIVGGGIAGMEAARTAAKRGHHVTLFEKQKTLGGNLIPGGSHKFKTEVRDLNAWYQRELAELPVTIKLEMKIDTEQLEKLPADVIIFAVGAKPIIPKISGIDQNIVIGCIDALNHPEKISDKVVIVGGGLVGCEMALTYAEQGRDVTVIEALDNILSAGIPVPVPNRQMIFDLFEHHHIKVLTGRKIVKIKDHGIVLAADGNEMDIQADSVVIAVGFQPRKSMVAELEKSGAVVYEIGDGHQVGTIMKAIWDGYEIANNI